jgi:hypothetical protein
MMKKRGFLSNVSLIFLGPINNADGPFSMSLYELSLNEDESFVAPRTIRWQAEKIRL